MGDKPAGNASSNQRRSGTPSASQKLPGNVPATRTRANAAAAAGDVPYMGDAAGDTTIVERIISPVKDRDTAVQFLSSCGLWAKQPTTTVRQAVTATRRAILQVALFANKNLGDANLVNSNLVNALLAIYHVFSAYCGEVATGALASTAADLTTDDLGRAVHDAVLEFLSGDKDSLNADGTEQPSLLRMLDDSMARHCELLTGTVRAEATLTRERIEDARKDIVEKSTAQPTPTQPRLYSEAHLGHGLHVDRFAGRSREEQDSIARVEIHERQILIDPDTSTSAVWADGTPRELIERANMAVTAALTQHPLSSDDPLHGSGNLTVLSVSRLRNRGVLFNFRNKLAADWVRQHRTAFLAAFDAAAIMRDRGYQVLVKNVPVEVDISSSDTLRSIEKSNGLPANSILGAGWLRPIQRRKREQRNAHLRLAVSSPELANSLITARIIVEGSFLQAERLMPDPLRCAKCQRHGHIAKACHQPDDTCGNCANSHETKKCYTQDFLCSNCKGKDGVNAHHAAWDRSCPYRLKKLEEMKQRRPEDFTRLFLTSSNTDTVLPRAQPMVTVRYESEMRSARAQQRAPLPPRGRSESTAPQRTTGRASRPPSLAPSRRPRGSSDASGSGTQRRSARSRSKSLTRNSIMPEDNTDDLT